MACEALYFAAQYALRFPLIELMRWLAVGHLIWIYAVFKSICFGITDFNVNNKTSEPGCSKLH